MARVIPTASNEASSKHPLQLTRPRDKWRPILTAVLVCAFVWLVLLTFCADEDEPRFERKRLTVWLDEYQKDCGELFQSHGPHVRFSDEGEYKSEARSAIRKIGTNAVPVLMRLLSAKGSRIRRSMRPLNDSENKRSKRKLPDSTRMHGPKKKRC